MVLTVTVGSLVETADRVIVTIPETILIVGPVKGRTCDVHRRRFSDNLSAQRAVTKIASDPLSTSARNV